MKQTAKSAIVPVMSLMIQTVMPTMREAGVDERLLQTPPSKPIKSTAPASDLRLTQRDLQMLTALYEFGGVLSTVQIAVLFFGPDLRRRLTGWHIDPARVGEWLHQFDEHDLHEKIELLKWCLQVNRLRRRQPTPKALQKLRDWLVELAHRQPEAWSELSQLLDQVEATEPGDWLTAAIEGNLPLPQAFLLRPQNASDFVSSACKHRLRYLMSAGLLDPDQPPTRLQDGRAQTCWFLSRSGRDLVAQLRRVKPRQLDWKPVGSYGMLHLTHRLAVNDFRIAVQLACQRRGYTIRRWIDDNELRRLLGKEKVTLPSADAGAETEKQQALKIPDGFFWLDMGEDKQRHCWFEFDNQTLTVQETGSSAKDYAQKIRTMSAFYRLGRYKQVFPEAKDSMWYLTVTSGSEQRVHSLKTAAEKVIGKGNKALDRYWFAQMGHISTWEHYFRTGVFESIWQRAGQERLWRLDEEV